MGTGNAPPAYLFVLSLSRKVKTYNLLINILYALFNDDYDIIFKLVLATI